MLIGTMAVSVADVIGIVLLLRPPRNNTSKPETPMQASRTQAGEGQQVNDQAKAPKVDKESRSQTEIGSKQSAGQSQSEGDPIKKKSAMRAIRSQIAARKAIRSQLIKTLYEYVAPTVYCNRFMFRREVA